MYGRYIVSSVKTARAGIAEGSAAARGDDDDAAVEGIQGMIYITDGTMKRECEKG